MGAEREVIRGCDATRFTELRALEPYYHTRPWSAALAGKRVLVTAGPTQESLDPVRYLTNHSTGKMGYAIAEAAAERGADVTLISGPVSLKTPGGVKRVDIVSSDELCDSVIERFPGCDILVMAAAPADFTPAEFSSEKIKKGGDNLTLNLRATRDILKTIAPLKSNQKVMGFAAETHNVENNAQNHSLTETRLNR